MPGKVMVEACFHGMNSVMASWDVANLSSFSKRCRLLPLTDYQRWWLSPGHARFRDTQSRPATQRMLSIARDLYSLSGKRVARRPNTEKRVYIFFPVRFDAFYVCLYVYMYVCTYIDTWRGYRYVDLGTTSFTSSLSPLDACRGTILRKFPCSCQQDGVTWVLVMMIHVLYRYGLYVVLWIELGFCFLTSHRGKY